MASAKTIDDLFQLPLADFTAARNALAAHLKKGGRADDAAAVKALAKPSVAAWTANQLFWRHRKAFDRLMTSGEAFRAAQAAQLAGTSADLRKALDARREALAELSRIGASILKGAGHNPSPDTMRRLTTTLEALSTYAGSPNGPVAGQLVDDVDPPGFETLAALVPTVGGSRTGAGTGSVLRFDPAKGRTPRRGGKEADPRQQEADRKAQQAQARAALQEAERTLRDAQKAAGKAEAALKVTAARLKTVEREKAELEGALEKVTAALSEARQEARRVSGEAEDAAQAVTEAEGALEAARRRLEEI